MVWSKVMNKEQTDLQNYLIGRWDYIGKLDCLKECANHWDLSLREIIEVWEQTYNI